MTAFYARSDGRGYRSCCKYCHVAKGTDWKRTPRGKASNSASWHRYHGGARGQAYFAENRERIGERNRRYRQANLERILGQDREYYRQNAAQRKAYQAAYRQTHQETKAAYQRTYHQQHLSERREKDRQRRQTDVAFRLGLGLRNRLNAAIRMQCKTGSAVRDLGCSTEQFMQYIAGRFQSGMRWENWGRWHLDHIRPLHSFDLTDRAQLLAACHYTNLQPLWATENIRKGGKS